MTNVLHTAPFLPVPDPRPQDEPWPDMVWPIPPATMLVGRNLDLIPLNPREHAEPLFAALDDDRVWTHFQCRAANPVEFGDKLADRCARLGWHPWAVRLTRETQGFVPGSLGGMTAYIDANPHDACLEIGATAYSRVLWGTTVNAEAKLLLLTYAFENLNVGRVQLKTDTRNHRSQLAIARLGARYEGTIRRRYRRDDGTLRDVVMFSITADDWPEVRARLTNRVTGRSE
ncbi:GNAT family N-acetyltransferase [Smaragdicoccus niigatensis]|uniref:GNAT family N-acetyltransferase n=1 Tax=Smaragdicoccus niigatensis TaxID=359359 RepID=UPI000360C733|nr:GNAT family protein [Smaragdicoccus niigatensis]